MSRSAQHERRAAEGDRRAKRRPAAVSALVTARNEALATGGRFVLVNPTTPVRRILQITGVLDALLGAPPPT